MPPDNLFKNSIPFAGKDEKVSSSRYAWDCHKRGLEPFVILQRTVSGHGIFRVDGVEHEVPAGHAFLAIIPEESRYFYPPGAKEPWRFSWLNFYGPLAVALCRELRRRHGAVLALPARSETGAIYESLFVRCKKNALSDPYDAGIACCSFVMEWARQLSRPVTGKSDPVKTMVKTCQTRFRESLGVKELADEAGLSREHLTRVFTRRIGVSPARYLRGVRVRAARQMAAEGVFTRKEIALRCGFPSVRTLNCAWDATSP